MTSRQLHLASFVLWNDGIFVYNLPDDNKTAKNATKQWLIEINEYLKYTVNQ